MQSIDEIATETEKAAPEATGAINTEAASPTAEETQRQKADAAGKSHKAGEYTRQPGEKRGRKSNAERTAEAEAERQRTIQQEIEDRAKELADYAITGRQLADGFIYFNVTCFGVEFNYFPVVKDANGNVVKDERAEFYKIGGDMAAQYGWRQLPPWIQIALVLTSYYGIRAAMPPVRQRFGGWFKGLWIWGMGKINKIFSRKPKDQAPVPENHLNAAVRGNFEQK